ncbi:hypothetical protein GCM10018781_77870 [Kitasatospora indigofera]|uniref:Uncharacterized protein n=1 Tax=Kitasatospora indigofera TaxID=67307 RepID=A0A919D8Y8_9ACTN|nr:hypothetical protein [Kitasatospora indigofera]GHE25877.1 hypothetical protein GCM10018781_77870 [Kitasatospora indigofera]
MHDPHDRPTAAVDSSPELPAKQTLQGLHNGVRQALTEAGFDPQDSDTPGLQLRLDEHGVLIAWHPADALGPAIQVRDGHESRHGLPDLHGLRQVLTTAIGQVLHDAGYLVAPTDGALLLVTGSRPRNAG